jgi:hypothetical protein
MGSGRAMGSTTGACSAAPLALHWQLTPSLAMTSHTGMSWCAPELTIAWFVTAGGRCGWGEHAHTTKLQSEAEEVGGAKPCAAALWATADATSRNVKPSGHKML